MPAIPTSGFIAGLRAAAAAAGETNLPETIVVRGYLGPPTDLLHQANEILNQNGMNPIPDNDINAVEAGLNTAGPWRIYLSARRDCWVEVPDWGLHVAFSLPETNTDRIGAFTVWLRVRDGAGGPPIHYRVVTLDSLSDPEDQFVAGRLIEDYMTHGGSNNVVWDEQQFGPTTGKLSTKHCF